MLESLWLFSALELGSVWMLGWLAAAAIPLALHLLHRRRQQELPWAAMELLMQAIRQNSRTVRIEQWLLLILRTCVLILFALALARPLMRGNTGAESIVAEPPKLWVIVMDGSYSMGYTAQRESLWQIAQRRAIQLVRTAAPSDAFALIQMAEPSKAVIGQPTFDAARAIEVIERLKCGDEGGDLPSCLELVEQTIGDAQQTTDEQNDVQIVFFTDLGRDSWQSAVSGSDRRHLQDLAARHNLRIETLAPELTANIAVTAFDADAPLVMHGRALRCLATVQNFSTSNVERLPVQFQTAGATLHTEFVSCPAGQARTVEAELQPPAGQFWNISAVLPPDSLMIDNRRDLIVSIRPQIRVLTVEEESGAARLVNLSLAPQTALSSKRATVALETWSTFDLQSRPLIDLDAVILVDVSELNAATLNKLRSYADGGGALLCLVGPRAQAAVWNRERDSAGQLLGFDLSEPSATGDWRVDPLNYASPIAKPFANFSDAGLLTTPIFRYWKIAPRNSVDLVKDLAFTSGDAWIVRRSIGNGWVAAMLSAPASGALSSDASTEAWNAIATWPSFVPIMQKIVETLVGGSEQNYNLSVGQPLRGHIAQATRPVDLSVQRPDGAISRLTIPAPTGGERQAWSYAATDRAGVYQVNFDNNDQASGSGTVKHFAVNIIPTQSDLQSVHVASLPLGDEVKVAASRRKNIIGVNTAKVEWISRACLLALLIVLACESLIAWHLGRRLT